MHPQNLLPIHLAFGCGKRQVFYWITLGWGVSGSENIMFELFYIKIILGSNYFKSSHFEFELEQFLIKIKLITKFCNFNIKYGLVQILIRAILNLDYLRFKLILISIFLNLNHFKFKYLIS